MPDTDQETAILEDGGIFPLLGTKLQIRIATSPERAENIQPFSPAKKHSAIAFVL